MPGADHVLILLAVVEILTGVTANVIIMTVNVVGLIRQRKVTTLDLLLLCLATSRVFLHLYLAFSLAAFLSPKQVSIIPETIVILLFTNELGLWFATWLSVFYCMKIATIPHPLFLWLKMKISSLVPWLIAGSLFHSAITSILQGKYAQAAFKRLLVNLFNNTTQIGEKEVYLSSIFLIISLTLPFLIFLTAAVLLIFFLGKHTQRMSTIAMGAGSSSRRAHMSAILSILSFVTLYVSHYAVAVFSCIQKYDYGSRYFIFSFFLAGTYPSVHSLILIFVNPKLKQTAIAFLFSLHKCCQGA